MTEKEFAEKIEDIVREYIETHVDMTKLLKYVELKGLNDVNKGVNNMDNEKVEIEKESSLTAYEDIEDIKFQYCHGHSLNVWYSLCYAQDCIVMLDKIERIIDEYKHNQIDSDDVICEILKTIK